MKSLPRHLLVRFSLLLGCFGSGVSASGDTAQPLLLGTSGGWEFDVANGYCCGGTLGALVRLPDGSKHVLSNFHVLAADLLPGDNGIEAAVGDLIIHPALFDVACSSSEARPVAMLSDVRDPFRMTNVDAALAQVIDGEIDPNGEIRGIGILSNQTQTATIGMSVKKSARTTGLTRSSVVFVDATIYVPYEDECAGVTRGSATFMDQIVIENEGMSFLSGGDAGAVLVEDKIETPRAVGLLFAGSDRYAFANPIDEVLEQFSARMVGIPEDRLSIEEADVDSDIARAMQVKSRNEALLETLPAAVGHAIGLDEKGRPYIALFFPSLRGLDSFELPESFEGFPVRAVEVGEISPL